MWPDMALIPAAYLTGAIPHLYLLGRLKGIDLSGDLHMALWRRGGRRLGTLGFILELVKGIGQDTRGGKRMGRVTVNRLLFDRADI